MYDPPLNEMDPAAVQDGIRRVRQRPLLYGLLVLAIFGYGIWYMTGGSAVGSTHQAEQLILTGGGANPGLYGAAAPATVHCSQNSQGVFARLYGLIVNSNSSGGAASHDPSTYYTCSGTSTSGQPMNWCVAYPPRDNHYDLPPQVTPRQPGGSCPG